MSSLVICLNVVVHICVFVNFFKKWFMFLFLFKNGNHVMNNYKNTDFETEFFAVNNIVKFSGILTSMISAAANSGVFYFSTFK